MEIWFHIGEANFGKKQTSSSSFQVRACEEILVMIALFEQAKSNRLFFIVKEKRVYIHCGGTASNSLPPHVLKIIIQVLSNPAKTSSKQGSPHQVTFI